MSKRSDIARESGGYEQKRNKLNTWDLEFLQGIDEPAMLEHLLSVISFFPGNLKCC
jgi:hypothetical protein